MPISSKTTNLEFLILYSVFSNSCLASILFIDAFLSASKSNTLIKYAGVFALNARSDLLAIYFFNNTLAHVVFPEPVIYDQMYKLLPSLTKSFILFLISLSLLNATLVFSVVNNSVSLWYL